MNKYSISGVPRVRYATNELKHTPAFGPLMGKSIASSDVARGTGKYQIPRIIRTTFTGNWNNMIYMIGVLPITKFCRAPITFTFLSIHLSFNIFNRVMPFYALYSCSVNTGADTYLFPSVIRLCITRSRFTEALRISAITLACLFIYFFSVVFLPHSIIGKYTLFHQSGSLRPFIFSNPSPVIFLILCVVQFQARFAVIKKFILGLTIKPKELRRCGEVIIAFGTTLLRNRRGVIHDMNRLSFSCLVSSCCQGDKAITSSSGVIKPSLDNTIIIPLFTLSVID